MKRTFHGLLAVCWLSCGSVCLGESLLAGMPDIINAQNAVRNFQVQQVKALLAEKRFGPRERTHLLSDAISCGNWEMAEFLIDSNTELINHDMIPELPPHLLLKMLQKNTLSLDAGDERRLFFKSITSGNVELFKFVVENIYCVDNTMELEFINALLASGSTEMVEEVLAQYKKRNIPLYNDELLATVIAICPAKSQSIKLMLDAGVKPDKNSKALISAIYMNNIDTVKLLLDAGADVNSTENAMHTPSSALTVAVRQRRNEIAKLLLKNNADPRHSSMLSGTPLRGALNNFAQDCEEYLFITRQIDIRIGDDKAKSPTPKRSNLTAMELKNRYLASREMVIMLLDAGVEYTLEGNLSNGKAVCGVLASGDIKLMDKLFASGWEINNKFFNGDSMLCLAVMYGNREMMDYLVAKGADPNAHWVHGGRSLLSWAGQCDDFDLMEFLLKAKADPNERDADQKTPLLKANTAKAIDILVAAGADINAKDYDGRNALMTLNNLRTDVIAKLIEKKIDVNCVDNNGDTPLINASRQHSAEAVRMLLDAGANIKAKNKHGQSAFDFGTDEIRKLLISALPEADRIEFMQFSVPSANYLKRCDCIK